MCLSHFPSLPTPLHHNPWKATEGQWARDDPSFSWFLQASASSLCPSSSAWLSPDYSRKGRGGVGGEGGGVSVILTDNPKKLWLLAGGFMSGPGKRVLEATEEERPCFQGTLDVKINQFDSWTRTCTVQLYWWSSLILYSCGIKARRISLSIVLIKYIQFNQ